MGEGDLQQVGRVGNGWWGHLCAFHPQGEKYRLRRREREEENLKSFFHFFCAAFLFVCGIVSNRAYEHWGKGCPWRRGVGGVCVCVCVPLKEGVYVCVYMCVCVWPRALREGLPLKGSVCVYVLVTMCLCVFVGDQVCVFVCVFVNDCVCVCSLVTKWPALTKSFRNWELTVWPLGSLLHSLRN